MAVVVFLSILLSTVQIGKARAERDSLSKQLYVMQQKIDSINNKNYGTEF